MPIVQRTAAADGDLRDIAYQIGVESGRVLTADKIIDELTDCCEELATLSTTSRLGTAAPELGEGVRFRRWVILFRYVDSGVLVLRIADGRQDYFSRAL